MYGASAAGTIPVLNKEPIDLLRAELVERSPNAAFVVRIVDDPLYPKIIHANAAFRELTGYEPEHEYPRLLGPLTDIAEIVSAAHSIVANRHVSGETTLYRKDGSSFRGRYYAYPIDAPDRHAVIILSDVTLERQRDRELRLLTAAIDEAADFVLVTDDRPLDQGGPRLVYVNRAFLEATGFTSEELYGQSYRFLYSPNNSKQLMKAVEDNIAAGVENAREMLARRKDGSEFWIEMVARPFVDPAEGRVFRLTIGRDITLRRRAFNQIALLFAASEQSQHPVMLYEPCEGGSLEVAYQNEAARRAGRKRLLEFWERNDRTARAIKEALERGDDVVEMVVEFEESGHPTAVQFTAKAVQNARGLEAVMTMERVMARAAHASADGSLLFNLAAVLPAIERARNLSERLAVLRALLHRTFGAEVRDSEASPAKSVEIDAGARVARFSLGGQSFVAEWSGSLSETALTGLRFTIELAIEEGAAD